MDNRTIIYIAIILTAIVDVLAHVFSKKFVESSQKNMTFGILLVLSYLVLAGLNIQLMKTNKFPVAYTLHTLSHVVVIGLAGLLGKIYFREKYSQKEFFGILLGVISIGILTF